MYIKQQFLSELFLTLSLFFFTYLAFCITKDTFGFTASDQVADLILGVSVGFVLSVYSLFEDANRIKQIVTRWKGFALNIIITSLISGLFFFAFFGQFIDIIEKSIVYTSELFITQLIAWFLMFIALDLAHKIIIERRSISIINILPQSLIALLSAVFIASISFLNYPSEIVIMLFILTIAIAVHFGRYLIDQLFNKNKLIILNGKHHGKSILLHRDQLTLGNSIADTIHLEDYNLCSEHIKLIKHKGNNDYFLSSNDYLNRSWVNFRPIQATHLKSGDIVSIGDLQMSYTSKFN